MRLSRLFRGTIVGVLAYLAVAPSTVAEPEPDLQRIRELLQDPRMAARLRGLEDVVELGRERAAPFVPRVVELLDDPVDTVSDRAAVTLEHLGPGTQTAVPRLVELIEAPCRTTARSAAAAVARSGASEAGARLTDLLSSSDPDVRLAAATALQELGSEAEPAVAALTAIVRDEAESARLRHAAVVALGRIGPQARAAGPAIADYLESRVSPKRPEGINGPDYRASAALALERIGAEAAVAVPALERMLARNVRDASSRVGSALGALGDETVVPALVEALSLQSRAAAAEGIVEALERFDTPESRAALEDYRLRFVEMLQAPADEARTRAARNLANLAPYSDAAVRSLESALGDAAPRVRVAAGRGLLSSKLPAAREGALRYLAPLIRSDDVETRRAALRELPKLGEDGLPLFNDLLTRPDSTLQELGETLAELRRLDTQSALELAERFERQRAADVRSGLEHASPAVRARSVRELAELRPALPERDRLLVERLGDPDPPVIREAAVAVARLRLPQAVPPLTLLLAHPLPQVRESAALALAELGPASADAVPALRALYEAGNQRWAVRALAAIDGDLVLPLIGDVLSDDDPRVRHAYVELLAHTAGRSRPVIDALAALLDDEAGYVAKDAGRVLAGFGPVVLPAVLPQLEQPSERARLGALAVLAALAEDAQAEVAHLLPLLGAPASDLRRMAAGAIGQLNSRDPRVLAALLDALEDPSPSVRVEAVWALRRYCPHSAESVAAMQEHLADDALSVRERTQRALQQLERSQPQLFAGGEPG